MSKRQRNWAFIIYNDINEFIEILEDFKVPAVVSPLHDDEGTKPHYHVIITFAGVKSSKQVSELLGGFDDIGGQYTRPEVVNDLRAYTAYLTHENEKEKKKYKKEDVTILHGFPYISLIQEAADVDDDLEEIYEIIKNLDFIYFDDLYDYILIHHKQKRKTLRKYVMFIKELLKSREYKQRERITPEPRYYKYQEAGDIYNVEEFLETFEK